MKAVEAVFSQVVSSQASSFRRGCARRASRFVARPFDPFGGPGFLRWPMRACRGCGYHADMSRHLPPLAAQSVRHRARDRSTVAARRGMVCTSQPLATAAGLQQLAQGGNCVDAAITANAVLSVAEPSMCGLGGDLFALVWWEEDRRLYGLNASGRAPSGWSLEEAGRRGVRKLEQVSPLSWTVPGCVDGWARLWERFGQRELSLIHI